MNFSATKGNQNILNKESHPIWPLNQVKAKKNSILKIAEKQFFKNAIKIYEGEKIKIEILKNCSKNHFWIFPLPNYEHSLMDTSLQKINKARHWKQSNGTYVFPLNNKKTTIKFKKPSKSPKMNKMPSLSNNKNSEYIKNKQMATLSSHTAYVNY